MERERNSSSTFQEFPMESEFLTYSSTFQEFAMPPPPDAAFFAAAAAPHQYHHQSEQPNSNSTFWTDFLPSSAAVNLAAANANGNFQLNSDNNLALMNAVHLNSRYTDALLESEFARLSLLPPLTAPARPPAYVAAPPIYDGGSSRGSTNRSYSGGGVSFAQPPQLRDMDIQRMRIQSAARGQIGMYQHQPQINSDYGGTLTGASTFDAPNFYNSERNLNLNLNQSFRNSYNLELGRSRRNSTNLGAMDRVHVNSSSSSNNCDWRKVWKQRSVLSSSLKDLRGKIFSVATDQHGCRYLQSKFEEGKAEEIEMIFMEVKDHFCELMVDQFGNYLVQKFLAACNQEQITQLVFTLISDEHRFMDICIDAHGSRSVQKVLEYLTTGEQRSRVIHVLKRITLPLAKSMNGHHVIQHLLKYYNVEDKTQILNVVADNCMEIATDKSGCCVLQNCVEHAVGEALDRLISEITSNSLMLSEHPYGNYVVQYILGLKMPHATAAIISQLKGNFVSLSMSKYGSNVVEKFLKDPAISQEAIIQELVYSSQFLRVLQDPFGNYVAQSAFAASKGVVRSAMISFIQANNLNLHSHPHGKRVLQCIKGNKIRA